jgi:cobalt/nickel transport protein
MMWRNLLLLLGVVVLVAVPLVMYRGEDAFRGADQQATEAIEKSNPDYEPWYTPLWTPPSAEVESMLFALQAAIGAGLVFYCLGYYRGRHVERKREKTDAPG